MSEVTHSKSSTATEPIINIIQPIDGGELSWVVNDGKDTPLPEIEAPAKEPTTEEPQEIEESQGEHEEQEGEEPNEDEEEIDDGKPKKRRNSKEKRINDLTRKLRQRESVLNDSLTRQHALEKELALEKQNKLIAEEKSIKTYMENIERAHVTALEEGDNEKAAEASRLMAQYAARHESIIKHKNDIASIPQPQAPILEQDNYDMISQSEDFQRNGADWIKRNKWADHSSNSFNPRLLEMAENYVNDLIDDYTFNDRADDIGTPEFFDEISNHVREKISSKSKPKEQKPMFTAPKGQSASSSVSRKGTTPNIARKDTEIELTAEQRAIAHSMSGIKQNGVRITDKKTLEELYKKGLK